MQQPTEASRPLTTVKAREGPQNYLLNETPIEQKKHPKLPSYRYHFYNTTNKNPEYSHSNSKILTTAKHEVLKNTEEEKKQQRKQTNQ